MQKIEKIPNANQEIFLNMYLTETHSLKENTDKIAHQLTEKFKNNKRYSFDYETYYYIVDLWKRGFFNKRYPNNRRLKPHEFEKIELEEILRSLKERSNNA